MTLRFSKFAKRSTTTKMIQKFPAIIVSEYCCQYVRQEDMVSLMQVNKTLYNVIKSRLYSCVIFDFDKLKKNEFGIITLTKLKSMRRLLKSPNCHLVKILTLEGYLVKNLSTSVQFRKFLMHLERFMFEKQRLTRFIDNSTFVDSGFIRNGEFDEFLKIVPINLLQEYKFPDLGSLIISQPHDILHLSKIYISMYIENLKFPITQCFLNNLRCLFLNKCHIGLKIDMEMLNFLKQHDINGISLKKIELDISRDSRLDMDLIKLVIQFEQVSYLQIKCENDDLKEVISKALQNQNFKKLRITTFENKYAVEKLKSHD